MLWECSSKEEFPPAEEGAASFRGKVEEVAVRTTTQVASGMIHLMIVDIWIWGSSLFLPQALVLVISGWKGLLAIALRPLFAVLKAAVEVFSLRVLKAYTCWTIGLLGVSK